MWTKSQMYLWEAREWLNSLIWDGCLLDRRPKHFGVAWVQGRWQIRDTLKTKGIHLNLQIEVNFKAVFEINKTLYKMNLLPMDFHGHGNIFPLLLPPFLNNFHPIPFLHSLFTKACLFFKLGCWGLVKKKKLKKGQYSNLKPTSTINLLIFFSSSFLEGQILQNICIFCCCLQQEISI